MSSRVLNERNVMKIKNNTRIIVNKFNAIDSAPIIFYRYFNSIVQKFRFMTPLPENSVQPHSPLSRAPRDEDADDP